MLGCLPDTSGVDPPHDKLIYPVGMAVVEDPGCPQDGDCGLAPPYLLVANSNFDLKYNAGTLVAINLEKLNKEIVDIKNGLGDKYLSDDKKFFHIPPEVVIDKEETIRIGSFASDLELTPRGNRAMIPVRGNREILIVDVDPSSNSPLLDCGAGDNGSCDSHHRVGSNDNETLPIEPYEVTSLVYAGIGDIEYTLGFATHLYGGEVSLFRVDSRSSSGVTLDATLMDVIDGVVPGASGIAANTDRQEVYVTGRHDATPHVAVLKVLSDDRYLDFANATNFSFNDISKIDIDKDIYGGTDARGIAVSGDGETAFVVTRNPEALLQVDTSTRRLTDITTLGADPSIVAMYENDNIAPAEFAQSAWALCFLSDQVYIVEPEMMQVYVRSTGTGPHAIAFDKVNERAFIANFRESTISIINAKWPFRHLTHYYLCGDVDGGVCDEDRCAKVDGGSCDAYAQIKIGKPELPEGHN